MIDAGGVDRDASDCVRLTGCAFDAVRLFGVTSGKNDSRSSYGVRQSGGDAIGVVEGCESPHGVAFHEGGKCSDFGERAPLRARGPQ